MKDKKDLIGIGMLVLLVLIMAIPLFMFNLNKTGKAYESICGDGLCNLNETIGNCPVDCTNICGNGVIENNSKNYFLGGEIYNETCDGNNLGGRTCNNFGYRYGGNLSCSLCNFNTFNCVNCSGPYEKEDCSVNCSNITIKEIYLSDNLTFINWKNLSSKIKLIAKLENYGPSSLKILLLNLYSVDLNNLPIDSWPIHKDLCVNEPFEEYEEIGAELSVMSNGICYSKDPIPGIKEYNFFAEIKNSADYTFSTKNFKINITDFCCNNTCGNNICELCENKTNCPSDCNISYCNNNTICDLNETKTSCPSDCECNPGEGRSCGIDKGICKPGLQTCNATGKWNICVVDVIPMNETCNNKDDNCNGQVDEGFDWNNNSNIDDDELFDYDEDEYFPNITLFRNLTCIGYTQYDCNDNNSQIHPGERETLNLIDDDCDGLIDENLNISNYTANMTMEKINLGTLTKEGSRGFLRELDWATFRVNDLFGKIEVKNITSSSAIVMVTSIIGASIRQLPDVLINLSEEKMFDLDFDGKNDILIKLESVQPNFKVGLLVKDISTYIPLPICNNNSICDNNETELNCPNDCKKIIECNNDSICGPRETLESCPNDCKIIAPAERLPPIEEQQSPGQNWTCNNDTICQEWENHGSCPDDCKGISLKDILISAAIIGLLLTIISGGVVVQSKSDKYKLKKELKQKIIRAISFGYNINTINYYLSGQKLSDIDLKKSLKYAGDFLTLKQAITFYLAQGHSEKEIKQLCKNNKWSKGITNEVFEQINAQKKSAQSIQKNVQPQQSTQKYQIKGFEAKINK